MKRLYGYITKTKHFAIRYKAKECDYSHLPKQEYEWTRTVPKPLGKMVIATTFLDAKLLHDIVTGKSVTAVLHFVNTTPTDSFSNRQVTVETATYGSEFVAAKAATEQIMDLRNALGYLGVPIITKAYLFGDNKSVVEFNHTSIHPQQKSQHAIISQRKRSHCHQDLEFYWCLSSQNRSDISKHWDYTKVKDTVEELFDYQGDIILLKPD